MPPTSSAPLGAFRERGLHPAAMWQTGSKLTHPFNPELGIGVVREIDGRFLTVHFPAAKTRLVLSAVDAGLSRLVLPPGAKAVLIETREAVEIAEAVAHQYRLSDGRMVDDGDLWPLAAGDTPLELLAQLRLDRLGAFRNRIAGLKLMALREAGGLGSFLGGRIQLFPHQLHVAQRAVESDPVRWLLADEVGLGKTVEACLVLSALVRTGRAQRALVIAPSTLAIQWLGELYRKFHQVFVLLDPDRIASVASDYGSDVNPFEVHPFAVIALEDLGSSPHLIEQARQADLDLVVVDEAHRLVGSDWLDTVGPLVQDAAHALLLTATPLQADRRGFFELLSLLHSQAFENFEAFERKLAAGDAALPCTSAVRRAEVGGLPPRRPLPVDLEAPPLDAVASEGLRLTDAELLRTDPRCAWLIANARDWRTRGEKALVFVRDVAVIEVLAPILESETGTRVTVFHEGLSPAKRDLEVAAFRESSVPLLLCSEAGGEGRNFQFCDRMVHFDLPRDPVELEQRIGRLDRIGRKTPVEIVYFRHPSVRPDLATLYEKLRLFEEPAAGLDAALAPVRIRLEESVSSATAIDIEALVDEVARARASETSALVDVFYPDAYTPDRADEILSRVPGDLETCTRAYCVVAAEALGLHCVEKGGAALYYLELGARTTVDGLPGVPDQSRYLGTFDREEALAKEELDFFASGHPLVEGLLLELEDGRRGRAVLMEVPKDSFEEAPQAAGLACIFKDGAHWQVEIIEADGTPRPEWRDKWLDLLPKARSAKPSDWGLGAAQASSWAEGVGALSDQCEATGKLVAAAFFRTALR